MLEHLKYRSNLFGRDPAPSSEVEPVEDRLDLSYFVFLQELEMRVMDGMCLKVGFVLILLELELK